MPNMHVDVPAQSFVRDVHATLHVSGLRGFTFRLRIGIWLMRLAALVIGCGFDTDVEFNVRRPS